MRRQFDLPSFDTEYLGTIGLEWETITDGAGRWLLIHEWPVPSGYTAENTTVALQIPPAYPEAQIDMAYFFPALARKDNQAMSKVASARRVGSGAFGARAHAQRPLSQLPLQHCSESEHA